MASNTNLLTNLFTLPDVRVKFAPFAAYLGMVAVIWIFIRFVPSLYPLSPGPSIAIAILFVEGLLWWPVAYFAFLTGSIMAGAALPDILILPLARLGAVVLAAYALRQLRVDPLFRSLRDILLTLSVLAGAALITPIAGIFATTVAEALHVSTRAIPPGPSYVATLCAYVIVVPFMLRWIAKPRFARRLPETLEILGIFVLLIAIDVLLFFTDVGSFAGISLNYFLLLPFLWIALRLRPRFVTLALVLTAGLAVTGALFRIAPGIELGALLFQTEIALIILAIIFLFLSALEEERRVTANLSRAQMATLQNALARISSESRAKNDFIAILAHELRNPLAPVASSIELLKAGKLDAKEEKKTLALMENRMEVVKRLLNDLLEVSRISERKVRLEKEIIDLNVILRRAIESTAHYYRERHQTLFAPESNTPLYIDADPVRIEQVFSNLLANASKYSNSGGAVKLVVRTADTEVTVTVIDRGVGVEPALLSNIFEPFRQVEMGDRTKAGLGIGLALVKSFVEMHDGTVIAESEGVGRGSRFTVTLPLTDKKPARSPKRAPKEELLSGRKRRILVVDDNDAAAWGVGKLLELEGYGVGYAYDGAQAIDRAEEGFFDVILLDIGLPDGSGHDVAKTLRKRGYRGILIALTGYSLESDRERGKESGFDEYLVKPVGLSDLQRVLKRGE